MSLENDVRFASTLVSPFTRAITATIVSGAKNKWRPYRHWNGTVITDFDPLDPATAAQPNAAYRQMHADGGRVHMNPRRSTYILTKFDDVRDGARDAAALGSGEGVSRPRIAVPILVTTDGEKHAEMRRRVMPAFTRSALNSWQPYIDRLAARLVDDVLENPGCDVVARLAVPMPMLLIAELMGVPDADLQDFRRWSTDVVRIADLSVTAAGMKEFASSMGGVLSIYRYFNDQFAKGGLKGSDTILGSLLQLNDDGSMNDVELFWFAMLLLLAGNETTTNLLGGMFDTFSQFPDQYDLVREDPDIIPMAIEEQLRFLSPVQSLYRTAFSDYSVGDVTIPAGSRVLLSYGAANRDPHVYEAPDELRVHRNPKGHLAFGTGPHTCLGAYLTRLEGQAVLRELVARVKRIERVGETRWTTNSTLRGPAEMHVKLTRA